MILALNTELSSIDVATVTWGSINVELGFSFALLNDSYAAGCGALCIGAVILVPFALKFGRRPIYVLSTAVQCGISIWSARMQTVADLMLVNVLSCIVGALAEVLVQMTVADMFFVHERGLMNTLYYWVTTVGVTLAPLAGGFITLSQGWRWVWWWMAILFGAGLIAFFFFYEETMFCVPSIDGIPVADKLAPQPASQKQDSERSDLKGEQHETTQQPAEVEHVEIDYSIPKKPYLQKLALWSNSPMSFVDLLKHSYQPFLIMFSIPAVFFMALEYGIMTACTTVPVTTLSSVMTLPPYNFGSAQIGLMGLPPFIGTSLATIICGPLSDSIALRLAKRNGGVFEPEMRLWLCLIFLPLVPAGLFMFGIGLNNGSHWLLPAFGLGINAFGVVPASSAALTYLTDAYTDVSHTKLENT
jgi:MFS family permease